MTIHLAGDSTVAPAKPEEAPLSGWGGYLERYLAVPVVNHAVGGATTDSFVSEGRWRALIDAVAAGDRVLIQFGHNDQKVAELDARGGYRERLLGFVGDVRAVGAEPILLTSVERRLFTGARVRHSHGAYPQTVRELGTECDVSVIDLTVFTAWLYGWLGPDRSRSLFVHVAPGVYPAWPDGAADDTHFNAEGAKAVAAFVAGSIAALDGVGAEEPALGRWGVRP